MSRQSQIQWQKRQEFKQKQQVNRLYAQKLASGMTPAQAIVTDGQTLDQIASQNNTTVPDLLNANPDMTAPKTGMVLSLPRVMGPGGIGAPLPNYNVNMRNRSYGGLPSNGALGATSTSGGYNMWQGTTPGYNQQLKPNTPFENSNGTYGGNPFSQYAYKSPANVYPLHGTFGQTPNTNLPGQAAPVVKQANNAFAPTFRTKDDYLPTQIAALAHMENYKPSAYELSYLEKYGMITKTTQPAYSGGGYYKRYGRGRGGGGYGRGGGYSKQAQPERLPAFSSGAGFGGLVNWRL